MIKILIRKEKRAIRYWIVLKEIRIYCTKNNFYIHKTNEIFNEIKIPFMILILKSFAIYCNFFPHMFETVNFDSLPKRKTNTRIHAHFKPEESCNKKEFRCETDKCIP